jgi:lysophospholipase L1-like esterase
VGRVLLALGGLLVALLLGELLVRAAGAGDATLSRGALHRYHPEIGWTCLPHLDARYVLPGNFDARVVCNGRGERGADVPLARTPGRARIAVLGDSFMWGFGVENGEMLSSRLAELLPGTEVVNLAANGYGTVQELVRFELDGAAYAPDWTLLAFTWNDLGDNFDDKDGGRPAVELGADGGVEIANRPVRRPWKTPSTQWLRHESRLFAFLDYARDSVRHRLRAWRRARWLERQPPGTTREAQRVDLRDAEAMEFSQRERYGPPSPEIDLAWETAGALIAQIDALARASGGRLLVIANAHYEIADRDAFTRRNGDDPQLDWDRPARRLAALCDALGVPFLDLNPVFRSDPAPLSLFFPSNGHWNPRGHALAAEAVAERLRALGIGGG